MPSHTVAGGLSFPWYAWLGILLLMIVGGGLEEFGWRGIGNHELGKKFNAVVTSLIIGVIWFLWHLPLFFIPGVYQYGTGIFMFAISTIALAIILTVLYNNTGSVLLCLVMHTFTNATYNWGFVVSNTIALTDRIFLEVVIRNIVLVAACIILVIVFGYRFLSRQKVPAFLER